MIKLKNFSKFNFKLLALLFCLLSLIKSSSLTLINQNEQQIENQFNQTEARDLLESFLLKKMGFNETPINLGDTKVPEFLLDIFETNSLSKNSRLVLVNNSNCIRSHPIVEQRKKHKSNRNKSGFLIKFNLTLPSKEALNAGEFRLYLNRTNRCSTKKQRIIINQILQRSPSKKENHFTTILAENNLVFRQIDTLIVYFDMPKWVQFDAYPAIESWIKNGSTNHGLLIKSFCVDRNEFTLNENKFIDNFIIHPSFSNDNNDLDFKLEEWRNFKPILLTYR